MINLRRTWAVARKEGLHILRDPLSLIMALAMPVLMLALFGYALTLDVDRIPTLVYDADRTPASRELIAQFQGSRYFEIQGFVDNYGGIERAIDRGRILMAVAIPQDFARNIGAGRAADVQILLDGSDSNTAALALNYADSVMRTYGSRVRTDMLTRRGGTHMDPPLDGRLRVWYNAELKSRNYIVPGLIAVILMIIGALLTSLTVAREWDNGTMEQLLSTPVRPAELVLGKLSAYFVLGFIDMAIVIAAGAVVFGVPMRGSLALVVGTGCLFLFGALGWGVLISAVTRTQLLAFQFGMISSMLPSFLLSGFVYAIETMPPVIQVITHVFPARYYVTILKGLFLKGVGLEVLWAEVLFLLIFSAAVFFLATRKLRQKLA